MNARDDLIVQVQMLPLSHSRQTNTAEVVQAAKALLIHPVTQALEHVFDDPITVMHHRRAHLQAVTAQQQKLRRFAPARDTANAGDRQARFRVARKLLYHVQRDRLDRWTAVTSVARSPAHIRPGSEGIQIDPSDGIQRVDGRESIGSTSLSGARDGAYVSHIRSQL